MNIAGLQVQCNAGVWLNVGWVVRAYKGIQDTSPAGSWLNIGWILQACKYIEEHLSIDTASLGKETLLNAAKTAMSSKIVDSESDFFAHMVVDAVQVRAPLCPAHVLFLTWPLMLATLSQQYSEERFPPEGLQTRLADETVWDRRCRVTH